MVEGFVCSAATGIAFANTHVFFFFCLISKGGTEEESATRVVRCMRLYPKEAISDGSRCFTCYFPCVRPGLAFSVWEGRWVRLYFIGLARAYAIRQLCAKLEFVGLAGFEGSGVSSGGGGLLPGDV